MAVIARLPAVSSQSMASQFQRAWFNRQTIQVTEWAVTDFKSIDYAVLPMTGLVFLTGANSSGKSSSIQSLLLLAQSTDDELILNGPLVRLGEARDVIRGGCSSVGFSFSAEHANAPDENTEKWDFQIVFSAEGSELKASSFTAAIDGNPVLSAESSRVSAKTVSEVNPNDRFGDSILRLTEMAGSTAPSKTYLSFRGFHPDSLLARRDSQRLLSSLKRNYGLRAIQEDRDRLFDLYDELTRFRRIAADRELPPEVISLVDEVLPARDSAASLVVKLDRHKLDEVFEQMAETLGSDAWRPIPGSRINPPFARPGQRRFPGGMGLQYQFSDVLRALAVADESLRWLQNSIRYLGPLREEPQVVSVTGGRSRNLPVGLRGEYTADLLARAKSIKIACWDPDGNELKTELSAAVSQWTTYLGVGEAVAVADQGKLGRGLRITVNGVERDLTTVGVGASQLVPIIALVLSQRPGSIIMLEQPELHLHPAVQSRLADFFLIARPDLSLIIETHSEYLITRMRRRVAEGATDADRVTLLFAEQTDGVSELRRLRLNALGDLSDWPAGFFDTQEEEGRALVRAISASIGDRS